MRTVCFVLLSFVVAACGQKDDKKEPATQRDLDRVYAGDEPEPEPDRFKWPTELPPSPLDESCR